MQKIDKKASILIWSIFLSLTMWIAFISISSQINSNLKNNNSLNKKIDIKNNINNALIDAIENNNFENKEISNNEILIFEKNNFLNIWLKNNEEIRLRFANNINMTIVINSWSPVSYLNTSYSNINWISSSSTTFSTWTWEIIIKNLWLYSNVNIFSEDNFEKQYKKYKIIQKIWNKNIIKQSSEIKLF